ncbi:MAG: HAD family phosphatase [Anaerolineae bacterium]|nr:HAD family phosphatase [Anaerolineae bacterium]
MEPSFPRYVLLALDVDGTLIGEAGEPSPRLRVALARARAMGIRVALCTGRPLAAIQPLIRSLALDTPPVAFNGALIPSLDGGSPLVCHPLPDEALPILVGSAARHDDYLELHTAERCYVHRLGAEGRYQRDKLGIELIVGPLAPRPTLEPILKAQFVILTEEQRRRVAALAPQIEPWAELSWGVSPGFDGHFVNVMRANVDKAASLDHLLSALGISWERVFAAGDSPSDLSYVRRAGYGVIMGNAPEAVREQAPRLAPSVEQDGLAQVIEEVVLGD